MVEMFCPVPVEDVLGRLPGPVAVERDGAQVCALLEPSRGDVWVSAALAQGCSLLYLRRPAAETDR